MKILALEKEVSQTADVNMKSLLESEAKRVWELMQSNLLREIYFRADRHTAVLVFECGGTDQAQKLISSLPLVAAGLIDFELIPLAPYDGFGRLFAEAE